MRVTTGEDGLDRTPPLLLLLLLLPPLLFLLLLLLLLLLLPRQPRCPSLLLRRKPRTE